MYLPTRMPPIKTIQASWNLKNGEIRKKEFVKKEFVNFITQQSKIWAFVIHTETFIL
jgi:hypothetical protein